MEANDQWQNVLAQVAAMDGEIIPHSYLKELFNIKPPKFDEYDGVDEFVKALELHQFEYLTMTDKLKKDLLESHKMCLKNVRGEGYTIVMPHEQTTYAYDRLTNEIKKIFRTTIAIASNVRSVDDYEQRAKDNDLRSKMALMKQVFNNIK